MIEKGSFFFQRKDLVQRTSLYVTSVLSSLQTGQESTINKSSTLDITINRAGDEKCGEGAGMEEDYIWSWKIRREYMRCQGFYRYAAWNVNHIFILLFDRFICVATD